MNTKIPSFLFSLPIFFLLFLATGCTDTAPSSQEENSEESQSSELGTSWQKLWTCDGAVVDVDRDERKNLQLVIRDANALRLLFDKRLISLPFGASEYVLRGDTRWGMDFNAGTGPKLRHANNGSGGVGVGVFEANQFSYFIQEQTGLLNRTLVGRVTTVFRKSTDITVQFANIAPHGCAGTIVHSTSCGGEGGGFCPHSFCDGDDYTSFDVLEEYTFHNCQPN